MKKLIWLFVSLVAFLYTACTPRQTPPPDPIRGSIRGILWHDICKFSGGEAGEPVVLGTGCVQWGDGPADFGPNQLPDEFEEGWAGVTLHLGAGACPSVGLATATTNSDGQFRFDNLDAGVYCVSYDPLNDGNDSILLPGGPTYPSRDLVGLFTPVHLEDGDNLVVNFGYAWQFYN
jgi:hypothetical protein